MSATKIVLSESHAEQFCGACPFLFRATTYSCLRGVSETPISQAHCSGHPNFARLAPERVTPEVLTKIVEVIKHRIEDLSDAVPGESNAPSDKLADSSEP